MAARTTTHTLMTAEDLAALPDDGYRYELIRGELVRMAPANFDHGDSTIWLGGALSRYVRAHRLGRVSGGDPGFIFARHPDTVLAPDLAFVRADRLPDDRRRYLELVPDLVVEILSPSDRQSRVSAKARAYVDAGVRLVWIADPTSRSVTIYAPNRAPRQILESDVLDGEDVVPGFTISVAEIFQ